MADEEEVICGYCEKPILPDEEIQKEDSLWEEWMGEEERYFFIHKECE